MSDLSSVSGTISQVSGMRVSDVLRPTPAPLLTVDEGAPSWVQDALVEDTAPPPQTKKGALKTIMNFAKAMAKPFTNLISNATSSKTSSPRAEMMMLDLEKLNIEAVDPDDLASAFPADSKIPAMFTVGADALTDMEITLMKRSPTLMKALEKLADEGWTIELSYDNPPENQDVGIGIQSKVIRMTYGDPDDSFLTDIAACVGKISAIPKLKTDSPDAYGASMMQIEAAGVVSNLSINIEIVRNTQVEFEMPIDIGISDHCKIAEECQKEFFDALNLDESDELTPEEEMLLMPREMADDFLLSPSRPEDNLFSVEDRMSEEQKTSITNRMFMIAARSMDEGIVLRQKFAAEYQRFFGS